MCPEASKGSKPLFLAIDDDQDNLSLITHQLLELFDCVVMVAADGQTALASAIEYHPCLILLDIMLPDMDGLDVIRQLRQMEATRTIPVIAVTALAASSDRQQILAAGCNDYLSKPYQLEDLEMLIRRYLEQLCPLS